MDNFIQKYTIPKKICDKFINYHKENLEYKHKEEREGKKSLSVFFYNHSTTPFIQDFFNKMSNSVQEYINKYNIIYSLKTYVCNHIQYYKPNQGYPGLHYERDSSESSERELVYMLYCNTVKNGGTHFPNQNKTLKANKGDLYIWPAGFTHSHQGVISKTEEKYIVTGWLNILK